MVILKCDKCGAKTEVMRIDPLVDWKNEEVRLPRGWFEFQSRLFCPRHRLEEVPATMKVVDK